MTPLNYRACNLVLSIVISLAAADVLPAQVLRAGRLPDLPVAISNNAVTSVQHGDGTYSLYSFMGILDPTNPDSVTDASFRFDGPDGEWTAIASAPRLNDKPKVGASAISVAGRIYLIGGYTLGATEVTEPRLFRYEANTNSYTELAPVPFEVDDTVVGVYEDRYIYLISGWHGPMNRNTRRVQVYDTADDQWQQATQLPAGAARFGHSGTVIGNRVISVDGARSSPGFPISDVGFLGLIDPAGMGDVTEIEWVEVEAHPGQPTYRAAASQGDIGGGLMLLVGGSDNPYNVSGTGYNGQPAFPLNQALAYHIYSDSWVEMSVLGDALATMDHRGLVRAGSGWATIGGMTAPGIATDQVVWYEVLSVPEPSQLMQLAMLLALFAGHLRAASSGSYTRVGRALRR